jgi:hypothetical protein
MGKDSERRKIGFAPQPVPFTQIEVNRILSVKLGEDEEVEWTWTYWPNGGISVTGYTIVKKIQETPHKSSSSRQYLKKRKLKRSLRFGL